MAAQEDKLGQSYDLSEILKKVRAQTPARLLAGRTGAAYRTSTQMELREAHADARDAVRAELNLLEDLGEDFIRNWNLFEVCSRAASKDEYLLRPDLGRLLNDRVSRRGDQALRQESRFTTSDWRRAFSYRCRPCKFLSCCRSFRREQKLEAGASVRYL